MGELTDIVIRKEANHLVSVIVKSFRDDSLPITKPLTQQDIATTAFVLFCSIMNKMGNEKVNHLFSDLFDEERFPENKYFKPEITNQIIGQAEIKLLQAENCHSISKLEVNTEQRKALFDLFIKNEPEEEEWTNIDDDFNVDLFLGNRRGIDVMDIIGESKYNEFEPRIHFLLHFKNSKYLKNMKIGEEFTNDSALDSTISLWLSR